MKCDDHGDPKPPSAHTLLARAWPVAEEFFSEVPGERGREAPEPEAIYSINRLAPDFRMPSLPELVRWTSPAEVREEEEIEFSWAGETARHVGTIVHRWLQRIAEDQLQDWDAKRGDSLRQQFAKELRRRGVAPSELNATVELVATALKKTLADERGRWILGPHAEARSEYRMRAQLRGELHTLVIDRTFVDKDSARWIVDFKTSRHEGADVDGFLDREQLRYAEQLKLYGEVLKSSRAGLYFPLLSGWRQRD